MKRVLRNTLIMSMILFSACGAKKNEFNPNYSSIYIESADKLESAIVEEFDTGTYDENNLKKYIDAEISGYNEKNGAGSVSLKDFKVESGKAKLIFAYNSAGALLDYTKYTQDDSVKLEKLEIYDMQSALSKDFASYIPDNLKNKTKFKIVYLEGSSNFVTASKIEAVVGDGIEKISDYEFKTTQGTNIAIIN